MIKQIISATLTHQETMFDVYWKQYLIYLINLNYLDLYLRNMFNFILAGEPRSSRSWMVAGRGDEAYQRKAWRTLEESGNAGQQRRNRLMWLDLTFGKNLWILSLIPSSQPTRQTYLLTVCWPFSLKPLRLGIYVPRELYTQTKAYAGQYWVENQESLLWPLDGRPDYW